MLRQVCCHLDGAVERDIKRQLLGNRGAGPVTCLGRVDGKYTRGEIHRPG